MTLTDLKKIAEKTQEIENLEAQGRDVLKQKATKEANKDVYVTVGRGTRKIKLGDIADTKGTPSGKGHWVRTNRGTSRRWVEG